MATEELENVLKKLLVPDNAIIQQATLQLKTAFTQPALVIPALINLLQSSEDPTIRQYCAILLRRRIVKHWKNIDDSTKLSLKTSLLASIVKETIPFVRASICQVAGSIARHELGENSWPELLQCVSSCIQRESPSEREIGYCLLSAVCEISAEQLRPFYKDLFPVFEKGLFDESSKLNPYFSIKCITPLLRYFGSDEEVLLKPLLSQILNVIKTLVKNDEEKANEALDIFDELVQIEVGIIVPYVKSLVEFCMQITSSNDMCDGLRIKALYLVCWACRRKSKMLLKAKLLRPLVALLLSLMSMPEDDENDDESQGDADKEEMNSLQSVAGQALDLLALHLPPNKIMPVLMESLSVMFSSGNPFERKASYIALGELAEGCADYIRTRYLQNAVETAMKGLSDDAVVVRNAALFALGQFAEHIQPEVSKYHADVIPVLLDFLRVVISDASGNHKGTLTKLFYAIETFIENFEKEVIQQYTNALMDAFLSLLKISKDSHTTELAISAIGALISSARDLLSDFFPLIMENLKVYLTQPLTLETMDIHAQTVDTLGALARYTNSDVFSPVAAECMLFGIKMIEDCDDPDLRRCTYGLFASLSVVLKGNMSQYLPTIIPIMINSLKSTEGIVANYESSKDPSFLIEDELDDEDLTKDDDDDDDDGDVAGYSVENSYMDEKEDTINSLAEMAENIGNSILPYFEDIFKEVFLLIDYPHANVRKASVTASCRFSVVVYEIMTKEGSADKNLVHSCISRSFPTLLKVINQDDERSVVLACVEVLNDLLKSLKSEAFLEKSYVEDLANAILNILRGKTNSQQFFDDDDCSTASADDDEAQAELDQMLIEKTGDVLPSFAQAIGGENFKTYFAVFLPELMKRTKKNSAVSERSFAAGTMAEIIQAMELSVTEFIQTIAPWLLNLLQDTDEEVRSNAAFALGVLAEQGKEGVACLYGNFLQALFSMLTREEQPPLVQDNVCGAVARMIMTTPQAVPLDQVLPVLVGSLPVKEDEQENETVTKCFLQIYSAQSQILLPYMEKLLPWFLNSVNNEDSGLIFETREQVKLMMADIQSKHPNEFNHVIASLS